MESSDAKLLKRFAEPFARAFAVFARDVSMSRAELEAIEGSRLADRQGLGRESEDGSPNLEELARIIERNDALEKKGKLKCFEINEDTASEALAVRLRRIIKHRGLTQKELAARIGISPVMISRVLKDPDRSKVDTLRKIAQALDIDLREII